MKIEFAKGLSFPDDVATQTLAFIARKGAGKSYAAGKLCEGLHAHGDQFVVLTPLPNWYGLRLAANGKSAGLDVVMLGGLRGDIPLDPGSGALVANVVLDSGRSFVLDVSQFSLGERKRFTAAFGEQLWQRQKALEDPRPIHVVLEEAQLFLPQQIYKGDEHMVGIWNEIVRLGRNCGIGVSLITQRPQSVTKEALTQVECLVVMQVNGVPEKKALKEWIVEKGVDKTDLLEELPFLKRGIAYVWSPQWLEHFAKHEILPKWTFDSGATPKAGKTRVKAQLKPLDLDALKIQMSETVQRLEANDPAALKKRVRDLEAKLAGTTQLKLNTKVEVKEVPVLTPKMTAKMEKHLEKVGKLVDKLREAASLLSSESNTVAVQISHVVGKLAPSWTAKDLGPMQRVTAKSFVPASSLLSSPLANASKPRRVETSAEGPATFNKGVRSMLRALASREPNELTKTQIATLAGLSPNSGTFSTYLSQLRTAGCINESATGMTITETGLAALGGEAVSQPMSTADLVSQWKQRFPSKVGEMLQELVDRFPGQVSKEELGQIVGITHTSGTYSTYLSKLRSNGLVVVDRQSGQIKASEDLFL